jgi:hypothetical protein
MTFLSAGGNGQGHEYSPKPPQKKSVKRGSKKKEKLVVDRHSLHEAHFFLIKAYVENDPADSATDPDEANGPIL